MSDDDTTDRPKRPENRALACGLAGLAVVAIVVSLVWGAWLGAAPTQLQLDEGDGILLSVGPRHDAAFGLRSVEICVQGDECWPEAKLHDRKRRECSGCETMSNSEFVRRLRLHQLEARFLLGEDVGDELKAIVDSDADFQELVVERTNIASPESSVAQLRQRQLTVTKRLYAASSTFVVFGWITLVAAIIAALSLAIAAALVLAKRRVVLPIMPTTTALLAIGVALIVGCLFVAMKPGPPGYVGVKLGFFIFGGGLILGLWSALVLNRLLRPADPDLLEDAMNADEF